MWDAVWKFYSLNHCEVAWFAHLHHLDFHLTLPNQSLIQQLNCVCDMLAKQAVTLAMTQGYHDRPTQLLLKEDVAVVIWGNKITDDVSSPIRFHASKEVARRYLGNMKKNPWTNEKFDEVDWENQTRHVQNLEIETELGVLRDQSTSRKIFGNSRAGRMMSQLRKTGNSSTSTTLPKWGQNSVAHR